MNKRICIGLSVLLLTLIAGCNKQQSENSTSYGNSTLPTVSNSSTSTVVEPPKECEFCNSKAAPITYPKEEEYAPITFDVNSYKKELNQELGEGVNLYKVQYDLNTVAIGKHITVFVTEVDLTKAKIVAGSYENTTSPVGYSKTSKIISQVNAWKNDNPDKQVYMATNADFYGDVTVNAFVKDGVILKNGHTVNYNDVPKSSPYLFGVSGEQAQVATMTKSKDQKENVESTLSYGLEIYDRECNSELFDVSIDGNVTETVSNWIYRKKATVSNQTIVELTTNTLENNVLKAHVSDIFEVTTAQKLQPSKKVTYLSIPDSLKDKIVEGTQIAVGFIKSKDGTWNYYDTILGARHALVEEGQLAPTVAKETSNRAAERVPHTAIGVKNDGKVMIVSVEDLEYYRDITGVTINTGVNLEELADFMRYYGAYNAANFDGGGSTQLLVNRAGQMVVKVRSADYGQAYVVENSRKVMNTILVVSK